VLANAVPEVIQAVDEGRMAVSTAALLTTEPEETQRQEVAQPKRVRTHHSVSKEPDDQEPEEERDPATGTFKLRGVGLRLAHEAINSLARIPKNDVLRKRGFEVITDWIRRNHGRPQTAPKDHAERVGRSFKEDVLPLLHACQKELKKSVVRMAVTLIQDHLWKIEQALLRLPG
jgi:hypothetical protein